MVDSGLYCALEVSEFQLRTRIDSAQLGENCAKGCTVREPVTHWILIECHCSRCNYLVVRSNRKSGSGNRIRGFGNINWCSEVDQECERCNQKRDVFETESHCSPEHSSVGANNEMEQENLNF